MGDWSRAICQTWLCLWPHSLCEKVSSVTSPWPRGLLTSSSQLMEHLPSREAHCGWGESREKRVIWTSQRLLGCHLVTQGEASRVLACYVNPKIHPKGMIQGESHLPSLGLIQIPNSNIIDKLGLADLFFICIHVVCNIDIFLRSHFF